MFQYNDNIVTVKRLDGTLQWCTDYAEHHVQFLLPSLLNENKITTNVQVKYHLGSYTVITLQQKHSL